MTCSISSSRSSLLAASLALLAVAGCAGARSRLPSPPASASRSRVVVLPPQNLTGRPLPLEPLRAAVELEMARAGLEVVGGDRMEEYLARHRIRYTGGVDALTARTARDDLGADAVLVTSIETWGEGPPPRLGVVMRLVEAGDAPRLLWMDGFARLGDDSPGLLDLGVVGELPRLQRRELARLARSLADYLGGREPDAGRCPSNRRFEPRLAYRSGGLDPRQTYSVAVLPFVNDATVPQAGEIVMLEVVRQLHLTQGFDVIEPGLVRAQLVANRIVIAGGVSLENARAVRGTLDADLVVAGHVREYADAEDAGGVPRLAFTIIVIDARSNEVLWHSSSYGRGDAGVWFFDRKRISAAPELGCRMARKVADGLEGEGGARRLPGSGEAD